MDMKYSENCQESAMPRTYKKLSNETIEKIAKYVEEGLPQDSVSALVDIQPSTLKSWLLRSKKEDEKDPLIYKLGWAVAAAHARFVQKNVDNVQTAGDSGSYQASQWLLEQRDPDNWGKKKEDDDVPVRVVVVPEVMSVEDWMKKNAGKKEEVETENP